MQQVIDQKNTLLHLSLARITFLNFEEKKILFKNLDSADTLALFSINDISKLVHRQIRTKNWNGKENLQCAKIALHYCDCLKIRILVHNEPEYPELLRQIHNPPYLLFCRGDVSLLAGKTVSVVGTRKLSQMGKVEARKFAYEASQHGINVVSGLANGTDGEAHKGALNAFFDYYEAGKELNQLGRTIAVLPSAIDEILPVSNKRLAEQILQTSGLIISEYEPKCPMKKFHYIGRNRIIAGLSPATVVIEAPDGSGALITADFAVENNRDVMFHKVAFSQMANKIKMIVQKQNSYDFAQNKISKYKIENRPEKFIDAGAPVIKDFDDYCMCLNETPGLRGKVFGQPELFDPQ